MFGVGKYVYGLFVSKKKPYKCAKRLCQKQNDCLAKGKSPSCKGIIVCRANFTTKRCATVIIIPRQMLVVFASGMDELRLLFVLLYGNFGELFCTKRKVNKMRTYGI
jgi:hypothetical protein